MAGRPLPLGALIGGTRAIQAAQSKLRTARLHRMTSMELFELEGKQFEQFNLPELFCQHPYTGCRAASLARNGRP